MAESYKPTAAMAAQARSALKMRDSQPPSNKGMTRVGLARANQLIRRENLSYSTVKRLYSYLSRAAAQKSSASWKKGNSKAEQAYKGWGGSIRVLAWSKAIIEREENKK